MNFILQKGKQIASFVDSDDATQYLKNKKQKVIEKQFMGWIETYMEEHHLDVWFHIPKEARDRARDGIQAQAEADYLLIAGTKEVQWEAPEGTQIENKNHRTKEKFTELLCQMQKIIGYKWLSALTAVVEQDQIKQRLLIYQEGDPESGTVFSLDALYAEYRGGTEPEDIAKMVTKIAQQKMRAVVLDQGQPRASFLDPEDAKNYLFWIRKPEQIKDKKAEVIKELEERGVLDPNEWDDIPKLLEPYLPKIRTEVDQEYQIKAAKEPEWQQPVTLVMESGLPIASFVNPEDARKFLDRKKMLEFDDRWKRFTDACKCVYRLSSVLEIPQEKADRCREDITKDLDAKYGLRKQMPNENSLDVLGWEDESLSKGSGTSEKKNRERLTRKGR